NCQGLPPAPGYLGGDHRGAIGVDIRNDDGRGAMLGEGEAERTTDATRAASDDRYPVLDLHAQCVPRRPRVAAWAHAARSGSAAIKSAYFLRASSRLPGMYSVGQRPGCGW